MKNGFDVRSYLGQEDKVTQNMNLAMERIASDLSTAFIIPTKQTARAGLDGRTLFKITKNSDSDTLEMTYMGHRAIKGDAKESDISFVRYEIKEDRDRPGVKNLYRGEFPRTPSSFSEPPPMELFIEDIATLRFHIWVGDDWSSNKWDSTSGDTRDKLPQMIRITIKGFESDALDRVSGMTPDVQFTTAVYLPYALDFKELKERTGSFKIK